MSGLLVAASVAPLLAEPSLRSEQRSQLVLGEGAEVLERRGAMARVRTRLDNYEGWLHEGYTVAGALDEVDEWLAAAAWSEGALLEATDGTALRAPHRARVMRDGDGVRLPDGRRAEVLAGDVREHAAVVAEAVLEAPADWAWREFAGTPYLWGGVTGAGLDCSGLVQTTFVMRGTTLPRDARDQASCGDAVERDDAEPGDLLFFRDPDSDRISHVALLAAPDAIVHSAVAAGGVTRESWHDDAPAAPLRARLVGVRRIR